ncbi:unnamed protein product [Rotaria socialis]|uniref:NmrA-like domain-containing protein n=1 Tax=Rotaria socialis TaxID=392032 RepID=A0A817SF74_9BILA|nr:unnamed protein product [Rotaria socialis]CAF3281040.1 unnamed protein product [Rotaria socialis]CAF3688692.1 unnamed protein product [Rotaria socialis]CAF4438680.1 unnamed protein product [Rotaria socialis]CAF4463517.1 unnamed protein product [Rotaria socialis]
MAENQKKLVVFAGGSGGLGRHIVDDPSSLADQTREGVDVVKVNYSDHQSLLVELQGVHTVISCFIGIEESSMVSQLNLLDACLEAKVKRFVPSE